MKKGLKSKKKVSVRLVAALLSFALVLTMLPVNALASVGDQLGRDPAENESLLEQLEGFSGDSYEEAYALLDTLGLLDEEGNLVTDQTIDLDGTFYSLTEAEAMLNDPTTDLNRVAEVDGVPISLGDLKTVIAIERELQYLEEKYFTGRTFEGEALDNVNDLLDQLRSEGMTLSLGSEPSPQSTGSIRVPVYLKEGSGTSGTAEFQYDTDGDGVADTLSCNYISAGFTEYSRLYEGETISVKFKVAVPEPIRILSEECRYPGLDKVIVGFASENGGTLYEAVEVTIQEWAKDPGKVYTLAHTMTAADIADHGGMYLCVGVYRYQIPSYLSHMPQPGEPEYPAYNYFDSYAGYTDGMIYGGVSFFEPEAIAFQSADNSKSDRWSTTFAYDNTKMPNVVTRVSMKGQIHHFDGGTAYLRLRPGDTGTIEDGTHSYDMKTDLEYNQLGATVNYLRACNDTEDFIQIYRIGLGVIVSNWSSTATGWQVYPGVYCSAEEFRKANEDDFTITSGPDYISMSVENGTTSSFSGVNFQAYSPNTTMVNERVFPLPHFVKIPLYDYYENHKAEPAPVTAKGTTSTDVDISLVNDGIAPAITGIAVPAGDYESGEYIPITITASEYIQVGADAVITINGEEYKFSDLYCTGQTGKRISLLYQVKEIDTTKLVITIPENSGITDIHGNPVKMVDAQEIAGVTLRSVQLKNAVNMFDGGILYNYDGIRVYIGSDQAGYEQLYASYAETPGVDSVMRVLYSVDGGEPQIHPVTMTTEGSRFVFQAENIMVPQTTKDQTVFLALQVYDTVDDKGWVTVSHYNTSVTVEAQIDVTGVQISVVNEPQDYDYMIELSDSQIPQLQAAVTPANASYKTGVWNSSDPSIATIDENGQIHLTGTKVGQVSFTYTADNNTEDIADDVTSAPLTFTVSPGDSLSLVVPKYAQDSLIRSGSTAAIQWNTNAFYYYPEHDIDFLVELYQGDTVNGTPFYTYTVENVAGSSDKITAHTIPAEELAAAYPQQEYTVLVSLTVAGLSRKDTASVTVLPLPTQIRVTAEKTTITDEDTLSVSCTIGGNAEATGTLSVTRMTENFATAEKADGCLSVTDLPEGGTVIFTPKKVTQGLYDTYTITYTEKITEDSRYAPSSDSMVVHVYRSGALEILMAGEDKDSFVLSNHNEVSGNLPTASREILALRQTLGLMEYMSINADAYQWDMLRDGIRWSSSQSDTIGVYYKQGGLWDNIVDLPYSSYLPQTQMAVSSTENGTAVITATHVATGMTDTVEVEVETLRDQFFLFQVTPAQTTTLSYIDGKGNQKTAVTNSEGLLALYEPNGITSDVLFYAGTDADPYLGTIFASALVSGERDAALLQLYPLNTITLVPAAKAELYLTKPDGTPYAGKTLTLRGGVYLAGYYCAGAYMGTDYDQLVHGTQDNTYTTDQDGKMTVYMDATQFTTDQYSGPLNGTSLEYWFELTEVDDDKYYPMLVNLRGSMSYDRILRTGSAVLMLEEVPAGEEEKPFLGHQILSYGAVDADDERNARDVKGSMGNVGPNSSYKYSELISRFLLWGVPMMEADEFVATMTDDSGNALPAQTTENGTFPFSSIPVASSTVVLTKDTMSQWLEPETPALIGAKLYQNETLSRSFTMPFRAVDLTDVKLVEEDTEALVLDMQGRFVENMQGNTEFNFGDSDIADGFASRITNMTNSLQNTANPPFKVLVTPSEDNSVFNVLLWVGYDSLGLKDFDHSSTGFSTEHDVLKQELDMGMPSVNNLGQMAQGTYEPGVDALMGMSNGMNTNLDFGAKLTGYYEGQFYYDMDNQKWAFRTMGGGLSAGAKVAFQVNFNTMAGPVPLTASFGASIALELDFKAATIYRDQQAEQVLSTWSSEAGKADSVNDYLTTLRINGYVSAFGGFGFDYSIVALKIGLYGKLTADSDNKFLSRTYLANKNDRQMDGQALGIKGEVGIKFVATLLYATYETVFASGSFTYNENFNDYTYIKDYWDGRGSVSLRSSRMTLMSRSHLAARAVESQGWSAAGFEENASVVYGNANPGSEPVVNDDGSLALYISDMGSENYFASRVKAGAVGTEGSVIHDGGFGDMSPSLSGTGGFSVAAWVRLHEDLNKAAGEAISPAEQQMLLNSTEIMVAVTTDGTTWTTKQLTDNVTADLAPVTAGNGSSAIVFWRSLYTSEEGNITSFDTQDAIYYSRYDAVSGWSQPAMAYNGTSGGVTGIQAAMLPGGEALVAFTLDRDSANSIAADQEMAYRIIDAHGKLGELVVLTNDDETDTNPQAAVISDTNASYFVLAWYSTGDGGDICLQTVGAEGQLFDGNSPYAVPAGVKAMTGAEELVISADFRFAKGVNRSVDGLTLVWAETANNKDEEPDHSILYGTQLCAVDGDLYLSAPQALITLPDRTLANSFSAWRTSDKVNAYIFGTWYSPTETETIGSYTVAVDQDRLLTGGGTFMNEAVAVDFISVEYTNLQTNAFTPIVFTLRNTGTTKLSDMKLAVGSYDTTVPALMPGDSTHVTVMYKTGTTITNPVYTVTAGSTLVNETLYLDYHDIGISHMKLLEESEGRRQIMVTLYNDAAAKLENSGRIVELSFYTNADCTSPAGIATVTLDSDDDLRRLDQGSMTVPAAFDLAAYVTNTLGLEEIPASGVYLYAKAQVKDKGKTMAEYATGNNTAAILLTGAYARTGEMTSLDVTMTNGTVTQAQVNLRNNSIQAQPGQGILLAALLNDTGDVLETKTAMTDSALTCEQAKTVDVTFTQTGKDVLLLYAEGGAGLRKLQFSNMNVDLSSFAEDSNTPGNYRYTLPGTAPTSTRVTFISSEAVTVNGKEYDKAGIVSIDIPTGTSTITISTGDSTYILSLNRKETVKPPAPAPKPGGTGEKPKNPPLTGDGANMTFWITMMFVSSMGIVMIPGWNKRRRKTN